MIIGFAERNGSIQFHVIKTLTLIREGRDLNVYRDDSGREHFFDKEGYYDGWGESFEEARNED